MSEQGLGKYQTLKNNEVTGMNIDFSIIDQNLKNFSSPFKSHRQWS